MTTPTFEEQYIDALAALGTVRVFPKGAILIQEGDQSDHVYVVLSGKLKVFLSDSDGKEFILNVLGPRQCLGEMALDGAARSASVMTVEPTKLAVIHLERFKLFLTENPDAAFALIVTLIRRLRHMTREVGDLALLDVYGRVARLLLEHATEGSGRLLVAERMTQHEIAERVGSSREMVSRIIGDLRGGGYISVENNRIVIRRTLPRRR